MKSITVITPTIGRPCLMKLIESLLKQNVKIVHLMIWDKKREPDGFSPNDARFENFTGENYQCYHYVVEHPVIINRKDNYLRCVGLSMANTNFVTQIDDDCWLEEGWLSRAIDYLNESSTNYIFCTRRLWENETQVLGIDTYESIGVENKFGYHLMETNSIVFRKFLLNEIFSITYLNNDYGHDRKIAEYLISHEQGLHDTNIGLNQIVPDFLLDAHKRELSLG